MPKNSTLSLTEAPPSQLDQAIATLRARDSIAMEKLNAMVFGMPTVKSYTDIANREAFHALGAKTIGRG